jgi:endonuclease/exonuclease/phosphatase family metal-dependent hydrolase
MSFLQFSLSIFFLMFLSLAFTSGQIPMESQFTGDKSQKDSIAGLMFYNVENFFDVKDDSLTNDNEYLPENSRHWTYTRMKQKMTHISKVLLNAGGWNPPVIVGMCEVENQWVLSTMIWETGLNNLGYRVVHFDSPDERGIDVAMLYRYQRFKVLSARPISVDLGGNERPTRDILYVKGILDKTDTLHVLVNHWPSRYGGASTSQWKRRVAAIAVKRIADSIFFENPNALMVLMGDFNENPESELFTDVIKAGKLDENKAFINPALYLKKGSGTLKFQQRWDLFDQIIVSHSLLNGNSRIKMDKPHLRIADLPFLLELDSNYGGTKPFRTYIGFKYHGGYSDHLPVWIDLSIN